MGSGSLKRKLEEDSRSRDSSEIKHLAMNDNHCSPPRLLARPPRSKHASTAEQHCCVTG